MIDQSVPNIKKSLNMKRRLKER